MTALPLPNVKACVFDAYGTLFDFASAARGCRDVLGDGIDRLATLWRDKQLQYTWLRATQGKHADFWQVTGDALDFTLETFGIENSKLRDRLMQLYLTLDTFRSAPRTRSAQEERNEACHSVERLTENARRLGEGRKTRRDV